MSDYFFKPGSRSPIIFNLKKIFFKTRPYLKTKNTTNDIFDDAFAASIMEFQQYNRLKIQDGSLNEETYAQIGREMSEMDVEMISFRNPKLRQLLYGIGLADVCADWETIAPFIPKDDFIGWKDPNYPKTPQNCFSYCEEQLKKAGHSLKSRGWGTSAKMNPYIYQLFLAEDVAGMKKGVQAQQFTDGVAYLKKAVKSKIPVLVGVDDGTGSPNKDKTTDHYVIIVGMASDQNGAFFYFYDNATLDKEEGTSDQNRIYCNCREFYLKGTGPNYYIQHRTEYKSYTVTQIRETM